MTSPLFFPCDEWAEKLAVYSSKELSSVDQEALDAHLASCLACKAVLNEYQVLEEHLHEALYVRQSLQVSSALLHIEEGNVGEDDYEVALGRKRRVIAHRTLAFRSPSKRSFPFTRLFVMRTFNLVATLLVIGLIISGFGLLALTSKLYGTMTGVASTVTSVVVHPENTAYIRLIHASPYVGTADVFVDGHVLLSSFQFASITGYVPISSSDTHQVQIALVGKGLNASALLQSLKVQAGISYSIAILGTSPDALSLKVFRDENTFVTNKGQVCTYNLSSEHVSFIVFPGNNKQSSDPQQNCDNLTLPAGDYTLEVRDSQFSKVITMTIAVKANMRTSVFLIGALHGVPALQLVSSIGIPSS